MPYARNGTVRIHYQVEGDGPPLMLHAGFTGTLHDWYDLGFVEALKARHRLILLDMRGHGDSDKPHDPAAYGWEDFVGDVLATLDAVGVRQTDFLGYSMGGLIGFALAAQAPERMGRMVLGGASPFPMPAGAPDTFMPILRAGAAALFQFYPVMLTERLKARLLASDMAALIALRERRITLPGFDAALESMRAPMLLYCGSADGPHDAMREAASRLPDARFVSLPGLTHIETYAARDAVLAASVPFLST
jgi:pimeloyl-ACP methyl ester carboxylesterase